MGWVWIGNSANRALLTVTPNGYEVVSSSASTRSPVRVLVEAMVLTTTSWLVSGRPRQFIVMWENSRCSILFHFEVPAGSGTR